MNMKKLVIVSIIALAVLVSAGNLGHATAQEARAAAKKLRGQQEHKLHSDNEEALRRVSEKARQIRERSRKTDARARLGKSNTRARR